MRKPALIVISSMIIMVMVIIGCSAVNKSNPADATFAYLKALTEKDKTKVINLSCKAWEEQASLEVDALLSVGASLNNVQCQVNDTEGDFQKVNCSGKLDLTYNDEVRSIDLSPRIYSMVLEDGQWRVCSYK
ncbi:MAG: hypothetical protein MUO42_08415 [Anaerolineaceae bacterium]|nr:hypothetical protein [Anaerolineaceae bacterium]